MKKFFRIVKNILIGIFLVVYFTFIILVSTLLLNKNEYGVSQFNDKVLILIDEEIANENYDKGDLVVLEEKELSELKIGDEIFVYQSDKRDDTVKIVVSKIESIVTDVTSPYVVLSNDGTAWGEEFVAGTTFSVYSDIGGFLLFITSKWIFFSLLIVPCFFILLYEIYLVIVTIKFGDLDDDEEYEEIEKAKAKKEKKYQDTISSQDEKIEELMKQINELKQENAKNKEKNITEKKETKKKSNTKKEK